MMIREALEEKQALQTLINCLLAKKQRGEKYITSLSIDLVLGIMKKMEKEDENFSDEENELVPLIKGIVEEYIEKRRN